jgi:hypothetical protein
MDRDSNPIVMPPSGRSAEFWLHYWLLQSSFETKLVSVYGFFPDVCSITKIATIQELREREKVVSA